MHSPTGSFEVGVLPALIRNPFLFYYTTTHVMKQHFEMTQDEFDEIKSIAQDSTPVMKFGDYWSGMDKYECANAFWKILGAKYGFIWDTAEGIPGKGPMHFAAVPR